MPREDLVQLLESLDDETRSQWQSFLEAIDAEVLEKGPRAARDHLEEALKHLLAVGWALHSCYADTEARRVLGPIGEAARAVEEARATLEEVPKKPVWSQ